MKQELKHNFFDCSPEELEHIFTNCGLEKYRASQVLHWVYLKDVTEPSKMKNLPPEAKELLAGKFLFYFGDVKKVIESEDGTRKIIFTSLDGIYYESILIPEDEKLTLCMSTQAGCRMNCTFCFTGKGGLKRNLEVGEIVGQFINAKRIAESAITNIVFMGMGEPFDNSLNLRKALEILTSPRMLCFSARKITVSTAGLINEMKDFPSWGIKANLAVSLNSADDDVRSKIMPLNRKFPLKHLLDACRMLKLPPRQRVTFEYVMLSGVNDRDEDIELLKQKLKGMKCKINLILFNKFSDALYSPPSQERVSRFASRLKDSGLTVTVRKSRGEDIMAACGQLG